MQNPDAGAALDTNIKATAKDEAPRTGPLDCRKTESKNLLADLA